MSKELQAVGVRSEFAEVVQHGEKLILPQNMGLEAAITLLMERLEYFEQKANVMEEYNCFPYDGAFALQDVLIKRFGFAHSNSSMFDKATTIQVEVGPNEKKSVVWGAYNLPGIPVKISMDFAPVGPGKFRFRLYTECKRKYEGMVKEIFEEVREWLRKNSLYKGKALRIRFKDEDGCDLPIPEVKFLDTASVKPERLILSDDLYAAVDTNLFTPIRRVRELASNNLPIKRGVLFGGTYGTGKTLTAAVASKLAVQAGITYLAIERADELAHAIEFSKLYQDPAAVIFCEDVDKVTKGDRSVEMDDLLNILDGIDSKSHKLMVVLTSNETDAINAAMLRPGRLDAVVEFTTPDAKAIEKLLRYYGDDCIQGSTDLTRVGKVLEGQIPAVVEEVVKRAKLAQLKRNNIGQLVEILSEEALLESAKTMQGQLALLSRRIGEATAKKEVPALDAAFSDMVGKVLTNGAGQRFVNQVVERLQG